VAQRLRSAVARASIEVAGRVVKTSVSVGVATFPDDADDPRELIVQADHAMYQRKEESKLAAAPRALAAGDHS
jgi:diguanylate cyclase (GGDEF)-like protein